MSFSNNSNTNARRIDPIAIQKPSSSSSTDHHQQQQPIHQQQVQDRYYAGNVQLMEARVMELSSTVRALYRSIQELQVAIDEEWNDNNNTNNSKDNSKDNVNTGPDPDFVDAIAENTGLIERHKKELNELIVAMNEAGASSAEVPDDINVIDVSSLKQQLKQYLTAIAAAATISAGNTDGGDGGIYL